RLLVGLPEPALGTVGGKDVPLRRAGAERIGREHLDARADQGVPALDVLGVAVPDSKDDEGVGRYAVVGLVVPLGIDEAVVDEEVDVVPRREEDDFRLQAARYCAGLVGRGAVGLAEGGVLAVRRLLPGLDDLSH